MSDVGMKANGFDDLMERARCVFPDDPDRHDGREPPKPEPGEDRD